MSRMQHAAPANEISQQKDTQLDIGNAAMPSRDLALEAQAALKPQNLSGFDLLGEDPISIGLEATSAQVSDVSRNANAFQAMGPYSTQFSSLLAQPALQLAA